jgi:hypothetical protein
VFCGGGNECYDELDHDTCEDGFVDRGFGCEPEEKENENKCSNKIGSAGLKYPQDKRTSCELEELNKCKEKNNNEWGARCDNVYELFYDDDCLGL